MLTFNDVTAILVQESCTLVIRYVSLNFSAFLLGFSKYAMTVWEEKGEFLEFSFFVFRHDIRHIKYDIRHIKYDIRHP